MKKYCTPPSEYSKWKVGDRIIAMNDARGTNNASEAWWIEGAVAVIKEKQNGEWVAYFENRDISFYIILSSNEFMLYEDYLNIQKNVALVESL